MHDVGEMQIGDHVGLADLALPEGVTLLDDLEETVVATLSPPRLQAEAEEEIESETELVGEAAEGEAPRAPPPRTPPAGSSTAATPVRRWRWREPSTG